MRKRRTLKFKLTTQAALLVAFFVFGEVALLLTLGSVLSDTKVHYTQMQKSRAIVNNVNDLIMYSYTSIMALLQTTYKEGNSDFTASDTAMKEVLMRLKRLETLTTEDPNEAAIVAKTKFQIQQIVSLMDETKTVLQNKEEYTDTWQAMKLLQKARSVINDVVAQVTELATLERKKQKIKQSIEKEKASRELLEKLVMVGVIFNIVMAAVATTIMTQKFSRRISVLTANTRRLSNNEELLAPIGGDDELSRLDESFRQMAQMLLAAQEKEKANEARIRAFIDNMQVGLLIVDDKGEITQSNPYVEELFGYSAEELIGQRIAALFCDSETMSLDAFLDMLTERALGKAAQIQAINSVGKTFPVEAKLSIMQSDLGTRLVLNIVDLTAKFEVERLKKEMVSMVSHDLKTPLSSIQAALALVGTGKMGEISDDAQRILNKSDREIDRLIKLIGDLLDISKMESGKLELEIKRVSALEIVDRSVGAVEGVKSKRKLEVSLDDPDIELAVDQERIVQVIVNLLSNAIKFSPPDSTIDLKVRKTGEAVEFQVSDQGPGISSAFESKIFTRFERDKDDAKAGIEGTGIGLAICKAIVEGHGGEIAVRNNKESGCTFTVSLPAEKS